MLGFDFIHTYSSDALAQGILKSFFAFTNCFSFTHVNMYINVHTHLHSKITFVRNECSFFSLF